MLKLEKPILNGTVTGTGTGVRLRPLAGSDAVAMFTSLDDADSMRLTGTRSTFTLEQVQHHCDHIERADDRLDYGIEVAGELIGEAVLNCIDDINLSASFRIAIWIPDCRNKGFGSEATRLLVRHGFEEVGLNRIELEVYAFNPRAMRVYEKIGFRLEGTRRQALLWDGEAVDTHIMAMLEDDYREMSG